MNKLSIGIPVYNQVATIRATIESCLAQSSPPMEIVVSENYSTDGTREVVESFRDQVRIVRPPKHCGMAANWNFCVRACAGEWVGLCSGDDMLLPAYVDSLWAGTKKHPDAVFVLGGWENFDDVTGLSQPHYLLSMGPVTHCPTTVKNLLRGPKASFAAFCFRRTVFDVVGGYNEQFHLIQDWMFQFDIAKRGSFVRVDSLVARYRVTERPSITEKRWLLYTEDRIHYLLEKIGSASEYGIPPSYIERVTRLILYDILRDIRLRNIKLGSTAEAKLRRLVVQTGLGERWESWKSGVWMPPETGRVTAWLKSRIRKIRTFFR